MKRLPFEIVVNPRLRDDEMLLVSGPSVARADLKTGGTEQLRGAKLAAVRRWVLRDTKATRSR